MKNVLFWKRSISAALALSCGISVGALAVSAKDALPVVSYGVSVLSNQFDMAVSGRIGNELFFDEDLFARALNVSKIDYIEFVKLPKDTEGELLLGSTRVSAGQSISGANLSHLSFVAAGEDVTTATFGFSANGSGSPMVCRIYLLTADNSAPTLGRVPELSLSVSTYRDYSAYGKLSAHDPEGDEMVYEIVSYPKNGSVTLTDRQGGTYVYTPAEGYVGSDSFTYVARDKYGNYSASATVDLKVEISGTSVTYADLAEREAEVPAMSLTEAGIMSGTQVGNQYYFHPDRETTRAEFLVMAMHAAGINEVPVSADTGFYDDSAIESSMKGYVASALQLGYISGSIVGGELCFLPDEAITRAEAAVIVSAILGEEAMEEKFIPTFADAESIPTWARDAVYSLHAKGILTTATDKISAEKKLTREECATLLSKLMSYQNR